MENLIGTKTAGDRLGYTSSYMRKLCADKTMREILGADKIGRDWLFKKDSIEKFAEEREKKKKILN